MNHKFLASQINPLICSQCKRMSIDHTSNAQCEACPNVGICDTFGDMLLCQSCLAKEYDIAIVATKNRENDPIVIASVKEASRELDKKVQYNSDFFNAKVIPIAHLEFMIGESSYQELHSIINERFEHFKEALFKFDPNITGNDKLRDLVITFRIDEREKLKSNDSNYQPTVKPVKVTGKSKPRNPIDRIIKNVMESKGITESAAREIVLKELGIK